MTLLAASRLHDLPRLYQGKVREAYAVAGDRLLLVTSNRVSAFDVVFPEPVPSKGAVLNLLSAWWFERTRAIVPNHLLTTRTERIFPEAAQERAELRGRCALVRRAEPIRFECVVRGHLDGSAWREYEHSGTMAGQRLPKGLRRYDALPEPVFTPATKAETGHDENITVAQMANSIGAELTQRLQSTSIALYQFARETAAARGLLLLDTKFEFGTTADGTLMLIDEALTPDSSRFRIKAANGGEAQALDKQFLRDWLVERGFRGEGAAPVLPPEIIAELRHRYERAFELITGQPLAQALAERG